MHFGLWRPWLNPFNRRALLEAMNDLVFSELHLDQPSPLMIGDFGCGLAAVSAYGAARFPDHQWKAVTICDRQIEFARRSLGDDLQQRIDLVQADFRALPINDESLDAVFFLESLCHADDVNEVLAETSRVLKPGGRLVVVDGLMLHPPERTPTYARRLAETVAENWAVGEFNSLPVFETALEKNGFHVQNRRELGWQITPCVAHSPFLVGWHSAQLIWYGKWTAWKRKHMIACGLGVLLGALRHQFGYYLHSATSK